jgi:hypothetical protein
MSSKALPCPVPRQLVEQTQQPQPQQQMQRQTQESSMLPPNRKSGRAPAQPSPARRGACARNPGSLGRHASGPRRLVRPPAAVACPVPPPAATRCSVALAGTCPRRPPRPRGVALTARALTPPPPLPLPLSSLLPHASTTTPRRRGAHLLAQLRCSSSYTTSTTLILSCTCRLFARREAQTRQACCWVQA